MRLPFACPMDHALDTPVWFENRLAVEVLTRHPNPNPNPDPKPNPNSNPNPNPNPDPNSNQVREPHFLASPRVPAAVLGSRAAVSLPKGLDDLELAAALAPHADVAVLEIDDVADR